MTRERERERYLKVPPGVNVKRLTRCCVHSGTTDIPKNLAMSQLEHSGISTNLGSVYIICRG